jgi:CubicO group peptidase (beta-lactamase class C family)
MMTDQLTEGQRMHPEWMGLRPGRGFGLGVSVVLETDRTDMMRRGGVGTVSWPGAYGGWWHADPNDGSVLVFLAHNMVDLAQMAKGVGLGVWAAVEAFQASAEARITRQGSAA